MYKMQSDFENLLANIRLCRNCEQELPLGPRPVVRMAPSSQILIIGQAPGTKVHESGIPWNDRSGDRLREWLNLTSEDFYAERNIAIMPMGFCYPGVDKNGGDNPPRPECAPLWHNALLSHLPDIQLTLLVGAYAQKYYLGKKCEKTMTATVHNWQSYGQDLIPLPHPSWRNTFWLKKNPWFESDLLPDLRQRIKGILHAKT
jgi:uracil-DNA glycosylase